MFVFFNLLVTAISNSPFIFIANNDKAIFTKQFHFYFNTIDFNVQYMIKHQVKDPAAAVRTLILFYGLGHWAWVRSEGKCLDYAMLHAPPPQKKITMIAVTDSAVFLGICNLYIIIYGLIKITEYFYTYAYELQNVCILYKYR